MANMWTCRSRIIRETIEIIIHPYNWNREDRYRLIKAWLELFSSKPSIEQRCTSAWAPLSSQNQLRETSSVQWYLGWDLNRKGLPTKRWSGLPQYRIARQSD
jgi:hypothetical protein